MGLVEKAPKKIVWRAIEYYKQKIIYYQTEINYWKVETNNRGEIPDEVVKSILADLEYEIKRKTF